MCAHTLGWESLVTSSQLTLRPMATLMKLSRLIRKPLRRRTLSPLISTSTAWTRTPWQSPSSVCPTHSRFKLWSKYFHIFLTTFLGFKTTVSPLASSTLSWTTSRSLLALFWTYSWTGTPSMLMEALLNFTCPVKLLKKKRLSRALSLAW